MAKRPAVIFISAVLACSGLTQVPPIARGEERSALPEGGRSHSEDDLLRLVHRLSADEFAERQAAERELRNIGRAALPILERTAVEGSPDVVARVSTLLEQMFVGGCPDLADEAEKSLERLAASNSQDASGRARAVLVANQQLRQRRAIAAIRELGGKVDYVEIDLDQGNIFFGAVGNEIEIPGQAPARIRVWLLEDWAGGTEGLWHVARLEDSWGARVWGMEVTNVRGSGLAPDDVQALAARLPRVRILERGASLGIQCHALDPCQIMDLVPDGSAERAGLQSGDIILKLGSTPISSFNDLVGELLQRSPNEDVSLQIDRYGERLQIEVTLGGWRDLVTGSDEPPEPAPPEPDVDGGFLFPVPDLGPER
jgi:hypothetical protein